MRGTAEGDAAAGAARGVGIGRMVSVLRAKRQLREQQSKAAQNGATVPNEFEKYDRAYAAALGASTCSCRSDVRRYAGKDIDFARDHLGHRVVQSTMTYAQISDARRNRTMRRLERSREFPIPS
jgi:integrase